ncbi:carbon-nitrogen hydrolase family protein [Fibrella forsythiae]|uniref:Carbon-nitrogen hydrolase family protein n=1 Tax=Fibrella forsythiae TaxID=2817061 RepID=A0ABS3JFL9_9BACT|nr:carbon-nitrogen hydrolase family protein [Fibrella forsythiae]MBO0947702.1 carbon-nitrogen hydrolase family protein [Fibrella forsythiae]
MIVCVAQTKPVAGNIPANIDRHCHLIEQAASAAADAIFFPELSLTGYEPTLAATLVVTPDDARLAVFQQLSDLHQIVIGVGAPTRQKPGICISMLIFQPNQAQQLYSKQYLHSDEEPFFVSGTGFPSLLIRKQPIALAICYELSIPEHTATACANGATVYIASVAKSVRGVDKALSRLSDIASTYAIPVLMANCVGEADGELCAGSSSIWNKYGERIGQLDAEHEGLLLMDSTTQRVIAKSG